MTAVGELDDPVVVGFPLEGEWLVERTPAYRIPSHGTDALRGARRMRWALAVASECSDQRECLTVRVDDRESGGTSRPRIPALMPPEWCRRLGPPMQVPCTCSGK